MVVRLFASEVLLWLADKVAPAALTATVRCATSERQTARVVAIGAFEHEVREAMAAVGGHALDDTIRAGEWTQA